MACEHVSMAAEAWLPSLCTAKDTMARGEVPCLTMAVANGSMAEEGWLAVAGKLGALDPFGAPRQSKAAAAAATDEMLHKAKAPSPAAVVSAAEGKASSKGKYRLSNSSIRDIISQRPLALPTTEYMDTMAPLFPPEWLEKKKRQHEEELVLYKQINDELMEFRQRVIEGVMKKGYFELDEEEVASMKAAHQSNMDYRTNIDFSRCRFATPEEEILYADGYHYPDEDDDDDGDLAEDVEYEFEYALWSEGEEDVEGVDEAVAQKISLESN